MIRERPLPPRVYAIADAKVLAPVRLSAGVAAMAGAGIRWIQLRAKPRDLLSDRTLYREVEASCRAVEGTPTQLWLDDRADIAALLHLSGVHLGQADLPPAAARHMVGPSLAIGQSTHDEAQVRAADADPEVDLLAVGPVFPTESKVRPDRPVGLELVAWARRGTCKPLVAIGGISTKSVNRVFAAGADSVAVLGAICRGGTLRAIERNVADLLAAAGLQ